MFSDHPSSPQYLLPIESKKSGERRKDAVSIFKESIPSPSCRPRIYHLDQKVQHSSQQFLWSWTPSTSTDGAINIHMDGTKRHATKRYAKTCSDPPLQLHTNPWPGSKLRHPRRKATADRTETTNVCRVMAEAHQEQYGHGEPVRFSCVETGHCGENAAWHIKGFLLLCLATPRQLLLDRLILPRRSRPVLVHVCQVRPPPTRSNTTGRSRISPFSLHLQPPPFGPLAPRTSLCPSASQAPANGGRTVKW